MSLGKVLLRPQLVTANSHPTSRELSLSVDMVARLTQALVADEVALQIFRQTYESAAADFIRGHERLMERALDRLLGVVQPVIAGAEGLAGRLDGADVLAIPGLLLDLTCEALEALSPGGLETALDQLLDVVEAELAGVIQDVPEQLLKPIYGRLTADLQAGYLAGDASQEALNRYMLARDLGCLFEALLAAIPPLTFDRELILRPVGELLAKMGLEGVTSQGALLCQVIRAAGPLLKTLLSAQLSLTVNVSAGDGQNGATGPSPLSLRSPAGAANPFSAPGSARLEGAGSGLGTDPTKETPRRYLWYAGWLLGKDLYQQGDKVFEDDLKLLFHGDGLFRASLEAGGELLTVREGFAAHDITLGQTVVVTTQEGKPLWILADQNNDKLYTIIEEQGIHGVDVYRGRVYLETDWTKIDLLAPYTFKRVSPQACDLWAWIMNFGGEYLEMILHAASIESGDFISNLLNLLTHGTYGSLKVVGPRGFGWINRDLPMTNPWLNWVLPIGVTFLASLEGIYTKDEAKHAMMYWLTLVGADLSEKFLYDHWAYMARDGLLSIFTLLNYDGSKNMPAGPGDNRPLNRKHIDGVVNLFVEGGVWILASQYPKSDFGFPNDDNMDKLGTMFGHWLGFGALAAVISTLVGSSVAWALGWVVDWPSYGWMNLKAYLFVFLKYMFYQYLIHDGATNGGKFDGQGDGYPGYPSAPENSPYKLPFAKGDSYSCAQGNLGIWSHTPHSFESQIYAFDFAMDKGDVVLACRAGVVDDFDDSKADHSTDDWNYITIRHTTATDYDKDKNGNNVITYATYGHGRFQGVRQIWADKLGVDVSTVTRAMIVGQAVAQGEAIMQAGDTGRSAYNHLHMHVKPQIAGSEGDYTIPFVFADVDEDDGRPRSLNYYKSGNGP